MTAPAPTAVVDQNLRNMGDKETQSAALAFDFPLYRPGVIRHPTRLLRWAWSCAGRLGDAVSLPLIHKNDLARRHGSRSRAGVPRAYRVSAPGSAADSQ